MAQLGSISEWNRVEGRGALVSEGARYPLLRSDFKVLHKQPEAGDVIRFVAGKDRQGRLCVCNAVHAEAPRRLKLVHSSMLLLLIVPALAVYHSYGQKGLGYFGAWIVVMSFLTYQAYSTDKRQARKGAWRESESTLHFYELLGGWPGAFVAQRRLRHKSTKGEYLFGFVLIIGLHQFLAIDALRGWPFIKLLWSSLGKIMK